MSTLYLNIVNHITHRNCSNILKHFCNRRYLVQLFGNIISVLSVGARVSIVKPEPQRFANRLSCLCAFFG